MSAKIIDGKGIAAIIKDELKVKVATAIPTVSELSYKSIEAIRSYNATKADYVENAEELRMDAEAEHIRSRAMDNPMFYDYAQECAV